jgi:hypothetical protein
LEQISRFFPSFFFFFSLSLSRAEREEEAEETLKLSELNVTLNKKKKKKILHVGHRRSATTYNVVKAITIALRPSTQRTPLL